MARKAQKGRIPLERCHLYRLRSIHALAIRIGWELPKLEALADAAKYRVYPLKAGGRIIQEPPAALQALHRQIHDYLCRIETPDYLHSAIKGRSYITNARAHIGSPCMIKIDVKKFFPSVPQHKVMHFFRDCLECAPDVAGLLANLICFKGFLATGSSASPIISYYAYKSMFDQIEAAALANGLRMTCYVDDITLTGVGANRRLLHEVRRIILRHGLRAHKACFCPAGQPRIVTGAMVGQLSLGLPHARWKAIKAEVRLAEAEASVEGKVKILNRLVSRLYEAAQIEPRCRRMAQFHHAELRKLKAHLTTVTSFVASTKEQPSPRIEAAQTDLPLPETHPMRPEQPESLFKA